MSWYDTPEWRKLRQQVLSENKSTCYYCNSQATQVDHKFPLKQFPELGLVKSNLVPTCRECNEVKGNGVTRLSQERLIDIINAFIDGRGNIEPEFYRGYVPLSRYEVSKRRKRGLAIRTKQERRNQYLNSADKLFD